MNGLFKIKEKSVSEGVGVKLFEFLYGARFYGTTYKLGIKDLRTENVKD
jgi:hypothetical protein